MSDKDTVSRKALIDALNKRANELYERGGIVAAGILVILRDELEEGAFAPDEAPILEDIREIEEALAAERAKNERLHLETVTRELFEVQQEKLRLVAQENEYLRAALKSAGVSDGIIEALSSPIKGDIPKDSTTWEPIHNSFFQDFRCLVSDGNGFYMGGFMGGQWYADDMAPILSEEVTHFMIINPPGITEGGGNDE